MLARHEYASILLMLSWIGSVEPFICRNRHSRSAPSLPLYTRKRKEELDSMLTGMGLEPARPKNIHQNQATGTGNGTNIHRSRLPINISLKTQLDYSRNGHTVLKSLLDPTLLLNVRKDILQFTAKNALDAWRQKVEVASNSPKLAQSCLTIEECQLELAKLQIQWESLPFLQFFNTWRSIPSVEALCYSLGGVASVLLDVPSVRLYQDSLFTKRALDGPTPWHTDARMAPFDTPNMLTIWIPLQDVPKDGTALLFVSKSHSDFALPFWNEFDGPEFARLEERYKGTSKNHMPLKLGDATVHSGWTLHCADGNTSFHDDRHALAISFVDADAPVRESALVFHTNSHGYGDNEDYWSYREWVTAVPPRRMFRHDLVPIVWPPDS